METPDIRVAWGIVLPPDDVVRPIISAAQSLCWHFGGAVEATIRIAGRTESFALRPASGSSHGGEPVEWISLNVPAECATIAPSDTLLHEVAADVRAERGADMGSLRNLPDVTLQAVAWRLRAAARGGWQIDTLELDTIVRGALAHLMIEHFGGRPHRANARPLDAARLAIVDELFAAHPARRLTLADVAQAVHMSPYHFHRTFREATGMSPHAYQTAHRMNRAYMLIRGGATHAEAATAVGFTPGHGFRRALAKYVGKGRSLS